MEDEYQKDKTKAERHHKNIVKALRKKRITEQVYYMGKQYPYYKHLNQYNKGKIHCSCPLCRAKTNNKHRRHSIVPNYNPTIYEQKINEFMDSQIEEYFNGGDLY